MKADKTIRERPYKGCERGNEISFSVLMPTFNQCAFIRRAISSLLQQTYSHWELIIINDGSTDATKNFIADYLSDPRIKYLENDTNRGLGYSLNRGIDTASCDYIAYLPSDDLFYGNHLETLAQALSKPDAVLAFSGIRFDDSKTSGLLDYKNCKGAIPGYCTQLVQVAHRKTSDRWTEREECVSEDLFFLFWRKLTDKGAFIPADEVTCEWTNHLHQRHKICGEKHGGGLNKYRVYYGVKEPVRFRSGKYNTFFAYSNPAYSDLSALQQEFAKCWNENTHRYEIDDVELLRYLRTQYQGHQVAVSNIREALAQHRAVFLRVVKRVVSSSDGVDKRYGNDYVLLYYNDLMRTYGFIDPISGKVSEIDAVSIDSGNTDIMVFACERRTN